MSGLQRYDAQAGNTLKVLQIVRNNIEAQMQGRSSDHKVLESDDVAYRRLLAFDPSGKLRNFERDRIDNQVLENTIRENPPPLSVRFAPGAINAVRQFNNTDGRNRYIGFTVNRARATKKVFNALSEPLAIKMLVSRISPIRRNHAACGCG